MVQLREPDEVIRQKRWTKQELVDSGFRYYARKKQIVMARMLPPEEAPMTIVTPWDTLVATAGYVICYEPGDVVWPSLEDYPHWPVQPRHFRETYARWSDKTWRPSPTEAHLMKLGCKPFYKFAGVWAKRLNQETMVQTLESPEPVPLPRGVWLAIGIEGEPYSLADKAFRSRYDISQPDDGLVKKLINFLRSRS
jgi:hypothetical protein